jgi:hypothetical protein
MLCWRGTQAKMINTYQFSISDAKFVMPILKILFWETPSVIMVKYPTLLWRRSRCEVWTRPTIFDSIQLDLDMAAIGVDLLCEKSTAG